MGERIRDIGKLRLPQGELTVELNAAMQAGGDRLIHLQSPSFRMEFGEREFLAMCGAVLLAEDHLDRLKHPERREP